MNFLPKLNLPSQGDILVLNAPDNLNPYFEGIPNVEVKRDVAEIPKVGWVLAFVKTEYEVQKTMRSVMGKAEGDVTVWFAFPKQSSRNYESEINSELGWDAVGKAGFDGVRGVALDEDWSAIRFRREPFIAKMTKNPAWVLSDAGKKRAADRSRPQE